ncbi:MAG: hypothetical protein FJ315_07630 [SAR202 cluster bacterium]|nr:hypothetical protein [SAR202 cluster bacterium]
MTNVRLDANGMPKAPVYDATAPLAHRSAVTAVDGADPAESAGIDTSGYRECRLDLDLSGVGVTSLEVQALFWNPRVSAWFGGGRYSVTSTGRHALLVACRGQKVFLKVTGFSGTSFSLGVDYCLS